MFRRPCAQCTLLTAGLIGKVKHWMVQSQLNPGALYKAACYNTIVEYH